VLRLRQYKGALTHPTRAELAMTALTHPTRAGLAMTDNLPNEQVMCSIDLVATVLSHAEVCPKQFARWRCVSSVWREACGADETLLMRAARSPRYLTKGTFMGLFGLTSAEADVFERDVCTNRHGLMYKYTAPAIDAALPAICGFAWWAARLARQAERREYYHGCVAEKQRRLSWGVATKQRRLSYG
jgi:hypothetical protein